MGNADLVVSSSLHLQRGPLRCLTAFKEIADNGDRMSVWSRGHRRQVVVLTHCQPWGLHPVPPRKGIDGTGDHREPQGVLARRFGQSQSHQSGTGTPTSSPTQTGPFPRSQGSCVTPEPPRCCQAHLWVFHLSLLWATEKASSRRGTNQITRQLMKIMGNKALLEAAWLDSCFPVSLGSSRDVYNLTKTFHCLCD